MLIDLEAQEVKNYKYRWCLHQNRHWSLGCLKEDNGRSLCWKDGELLLCNEWQQERSRRHWQSAEGGQKTKRGVGWKMTGWKMMLAKRKSGRGRGVEIKMLCEGWQKDRFYTRSRLYRVITLVWHSKVTHRRQGNHIGPSLTATGIPTFNSSAHLFHSNPFEAPLSAPVSHPYSVLQP